VSNRRATNYLLDLGKKRKTEKNAFCFPFCCYSGDSSDCDENCYHHNECQDEKDDFKDLGLDNIE